ncbi:helix-turn-helix domain-containing protein [Paraburkholderia domus]|uniref:HTH-type transcriptional activator RhaR n=1 Tax=Paraburkholderia domus TaxID=2793075 RepID=A0A9N8MU65_9BURK|nr:AraC family transcriptional regulator [Paraburkholderia domus]MBK5051123.1 AraC family transcriptional regulator [Burkholderia sp. R-70006]MBK5166290.1 AraC family transcriptional regulator [Burkholderia sp. R-70211]CAE6774652.1 HTH-type transcriptional activator RhaR [Paraburkholderia domus]CAE6905546.1 HTH-type transcriptional activator RhaR [Paraburkholderia domus]
MKPQYERVTIPDGCSIRVYHRQLAQIPFEWHHHPEYELTLTMNSRGRRFVGDHIADYSGDDLVLVPPDMPHTWASTEPIDAREPQVAIVIWFNGDWARRMADCCPEFASLRSLLRRAAPGLRFAPDAVALIRGQMGALLNESPRVRLGAALEVLACLSEAESEPLASPVAHVHARGALQEHARSAQSRQAPQTAQTAQAAHTARIAPAVAPGGSASEAERLNRVLDLLDRRFHEPLRIAELCAVANLSERSLHRYFARHVGESVGRYLNRLRIGYATRQLTGTGWPIALIATKAGFSNLANFNRQFLSTRGMTPSAYRRFFDNHGHPPKDATSAIADLETRSPSLERSKPHAALAPYGNRKRPSKPGGSVPPGNTRS